jgi:hypothetical protein
MESPLIQTSSSTPTTPPSTPSQDTRAFSSFMGGKQEDQTDQWIEDFVDQLHDPTLAAYILELQQVILEAWEIASNRKTHAQGHIQQHHFRQTRPAHQFQPSDLFFKRSIPQRHVLDPDDFPAARPIHRAAYRDTSTISGRNVNYTSTIMIAVPSMGVFLQQDEARLLNPQPSTLNNSD